jgi:hypothetical protein
MSLVARLLVVVAVCQGWLWLCEWKKWRWPWQLGGVLAIGLAANPALHPAGWP